MCQETKAYRRRALNKKPTSRLTAFCRFKSFANYLTLYAQWAKTDLGFNVLPSFFV